MKQIYLTFLLKDAYLQTKFLKTASTGVSGVTRYTESSYIRAFLQRVHAVIPNVTDGIPMWHAVFIECLEISQ